MSKYEPTQIEPKWQARWEAEGAFNAGRFPERPKFYVLEMLPYPSGRLHMGHVRNYSIGDVLARVKRMQGFDVMHPMGWDAFGMPAENAAIKAKAHPRTWTYENIAAMRKQLKAMGLSYDWRCEIATCDPEYYRWEQQLFIEMWERGLVYRKGSLVNWCPTCATVLANEQVEQGTCWRCHNPVILRELEQWFFRITAYADELLSGHEEIAQGWPEQVLTMQKNSIGKSEGAELRFGLDTPAAGHESITVFTTRPDTVFGATFLSLAAEHPLVAELAKNTGREAEVQAFVEGVRKIDRAARLADAFEKEGIWTGATCRNPATGEQIPIYAANFVLMEYGTGAVMAVPAHDQRDFEFARKYSLPIRVVIEPAGSDGKPVALDPATMTEAYAEAGVMVRSGRFDGLPSDEGKRQIVGWLAEQGLAKPTVNYRLRDWGISRQRYWGAPIPMVHCPKCGIVPVKREDLPITLPDDVSLTGEGGSPLQRHPTWARTTCPRCAGEARRETDTMDTFVESSWYFLRYLSPREDKAPFDRAVASRWMPVDQYIGGIEHAVMHLLYARFFIKVLRDMGYLRVDEPFKRLLTQGMVCKETYVCPTHEWLYPEQVSEGKCQLCGQTVTVGRLAKMSKSHNNVVDPDKIIAEYGADTARVFTLFAAPPERDFDWKLEGVEGAYRFLGRIWRLVEDHGGRGEAADPRPDATRALRRAVHKTIRRVSDDVTNRFHFNTAIAAIMELCNTLYEHVGSGAYQREAMQEALRTVTLLLSPFAPHFAEEVWELLGGGTGVSPESMSGRKPGVGLVADQPWPTFDPEVARDDRITVVVQVNGKLRGRLEVDVGAPEEVVRQAALADPNVQTHLAGREPRKVIVVPGRLVNLVV